MNATEHETQKKLYPILFATYLMRSIMKKIENMNKMLLNFDFSTDTPEKYKADVARIQQLIKQQRAGEITLTKEEIIDIENQLDLFEQRELLLKSAIKLELDTCLGEADINQLTKVADCRRISLHLNQNPTEGIKKCLIDQIAAMHKFTMQYINRSNNALLKHNDPDIAHKFGNLALKSSKACVNLSLALEKIENGGNQKIEVKHQYVQVNDGAQAIIANELKTGGTNEK